MRGEMTQDEGFGKVVRKAERGQLDADGGGVDDGSLEVERDAAGWVVAWKVEAVDLYPSFEAGHAIEHDLRRTVSRNTTLRRDSAHLLRDHDPLHGDLKGFDSEVRSRNRPGERGVVEQGDSEVGQVRDICDAKRCFEIQTRFNVLHELNLHEEGSFRLRGTTK